MHNALQNLNKQVMFHKKVTSPTSPIDFSALNEHAEVIAVRVFAIQGKKNKYHPLTFYSCLNLFALDKVHIRSFFTVPVFVLT